MSTSARLGIWLAAACALALASSNAADAPAPSKSGSFGINSDHLSVRDFGAICDGTTDDTAALRRAFDGRNYHVELPAGATCAFRTAPLVLNRPYGSISGAGMWGTSRLLYTGTDTMADLIQVGSGRTTPSGLTSTGYSSLRDFAVESATRMTGGYAIHEMGTQFIDFENIALGRQQDEVNLWGGFYFDQTDWTRVQTFFVAARDDCIAVSGHGAENHPATGPQYDLWIDGGRVEGCHIGVHAGGGFDGAFFDHMMVTDVDYDAVVDNALAAHPNQEILFGPQFFADFARLDNILIDDRLCQQRILCSTTISGPILHAGALPGEPLRPATARTSGNGIHVKRYPGGYVHVQSPYIRDARTAGISIEDQSVVLFIGSATSISGSPFGIRSSLPYRGLAGRASFVAISKQALENVAPQIGHNSE